ncbi:HAD family hydrolase [Kordiimonas marina]|uniref:HAD family hydrolase n=1 Tax=Kordiimonas marina TaxID=2872312 RepID=UPI001FF505E6|nr:HAD family hydrolase [Kordiimonas marina]MCJ9430763.1 HAD family hydrolase [Kordiimonas marina]
MNSPQKSLLITDLDNTLYDWVSYFVPSIYRLIDTAKDILGCDQERLINDLQKVHKIHHDSEHPFALLEADVVKHTYAGLPRTEIKRRLDSAFHAFNSERRSRLRLYEGVEPTLDQLKSRGIKVVAYTESKFFGVVDRIRRLGLEAHIDKVYCRERSETVHPDEKPVSEWLADFPAHKVVEQCVHSLKPNPEVLLEICASEGVAPEHAVYVGDSLPKDIYMAKQAGITSVWAKYGSMVDLDLYDKLIRISHWTTADIEREKKFKLLAQGMQVDLIAEEKFSEVLKAFS